MVKFIDTYSFTYLTALYQLLRDVKREENAEEVASHHKLWLGEYGVCL